MDFPLQILDIHYVHFKKQQDRFVKAEFGLVTI